MNQRGKDIWELAMAEEETYNVEENKRKGIWEYLKDGLNGGT